MSITQLSGEAKFVPVASAEETLPPKRRRYTTAYKLRILEQADACTVSGTLASLLRREGLYFSTLKDFRRQRARGDLDLVAAPRHTAPPAASDAQALEERVALERDLRRLRRELEKAHALIELQKKVSKLMGLSLEPLD